MPPSYVGFMEGDIVVPVGYRSAHLHKMSKYTNVTLCGASTKGSHWEAASPWHFDNYEICGRCNLILENHRKWLEENMVEDDKRYDSVEHVKNALKQKDRLIDKKEEEINRLRGVVNAERSTRLQMQGQLDDEKTLHQATQRDKEVLMRQVEERAAELTQMRQGLVYPPEGNWVGRDAYNEMMKERDRALADVKSLGATVERFALEKTAAEARATELEFFKASAGDVGEEFRLQGIRRYFHDARNSELVWEIWSANRKVEPDRVGDIRKVRVIGNLSVRERRVRSRRASGDRRQS